MTDFNHSVPSVSESTLKRLERVEKDGAQSFTKVLPDANLQLNCFIDRGYFF
jgi:DNA (cytosine-5)-methyltransferase 1